MKKRVYRLLLTLIFLFLIVSPFAYGQGNSIFSIDIDIELQENGEAHIKEVWDVEAWQGTEIYLVKAHLQENQMSVYDLKVTDEKGNVFETLDNWDTSGSLEEKAGKAGYNYTSSGVELCFGFGSYGKHTFTIEYKMKNFLVEYADQTPGFHVRVVNDQMSSVIDSVNVKISKPGVNFTGENTKIWAFGFPGEIHTVEGSIQAVSKAPLYSDNYVNIMASFDKELFSPAFQNTKTFDDVKNQAFVGSDYENEENIGKGGRSSSLVRQAPGKDRVVEEDKRSNILINIIAGIFTFFSFVIPIVFILLVIRLHSISTRQGLTSGSKRVLKEVVSAKSQDYYRDIPVEGNLRAANEILQYMGKAKRQNLISAYILDWVRKGYIQLETEEVSSFFGLRTKEETSIGGLDENAPKDPNERRLYNLMVIASGTDKILQKKEFYRWSKRNYREVDSWYSHVRKEGEILLQNMGAITVAKDTAFLGKIKISSVELTDIGLEHVGNMAAFENFLDDFTLLHEREPMEVEVWEEYLVYAALLGIAEEVAKAFEELQPAFFSDSNFGGDYNSTLHTITIATAMSHAMSSGATVGNPSSGGSSGGGGFSSSGGGGGFSGGGSGGGFR